MKKSFAIFQVQTDSESEEVSQASSENDDTNNLVKLSLTLRSNMSNDQRSMICQKLAHQFSFDGPYAVQEIVQCTQEHTDEDSVDGMKRKSLQKKASPGIFSYLSQVRVHVYASVKFLD